MSNNATPANRTLYAPQRHDEIMSAARRAGRVEVNGLAEQLNVTPKTIRRGLAALERLGKIRRVHGGALPVVETGPEPSLLDRLGRHSEAKECIAARAVLELPSRARSACTDSPAYTKSRYSSPTTDWMTRPAAHSTLPEWR